MTAARDGTPFHNRVARAAGVLAEQRLDGLIVVSDPAVTYFTGFQHFKTTKFLGWATAVIVGGDGRSVLCSPALTLRYAQQRAHADAVRRYDPTARGLAEAAVAALASVRRRTEVRVGIEAAHLPTGHYLALQDALAPAELIDVTGALGRLRGVKDAHELDAMRRAAKVADAGMGAAARDLTPGRTELEIAAAAAEAMLAAGADVVCHCSVKSGLNSALIQSFSSSRRIEPTDVVNIDLGAVVDGYCSDLTRTFAAGAVGPRQRDLFELALQALDGAARAARPGVSGGEVDAAARDVFGRAGYVGDAFPHLTGHGIGLEVHEPPILAPRSDDVLSPGMVVCLEPGVYDVEIGGMRTEDMFLVTLSGLERLTQFPRDVTWR